MFSVFVTSKFTYLNLCLLIFFQNQLFQKILSGIPSVLNSLDPDQTDQTFCRTWSGSKLFTKVISRWELKDLSSYKWDFCNQSRPRWGATFCDQWHLVCVNTVCYHKLYFFSCFPSLHHIGHCAVSLSMSKKTLSSAQYWFNSQEHSDITEKLLTRMQSTNINMGLLIL